MKHWKRVNIKNFEHHANDFMLYFVNNKEKFKIYNTFWNQFKPEYYKCFFNERTEFEQELIKFGTIKEITLLILVHSNTTLHTDHTSGLNKDVNYRLNIPIKNCEGSLTCFYDIPQDQKLNFSTTSGGTKAWHIPLNNIKPITSVELSSPTIIHTSFPHAVISITNKLPRIAMTISFKEDLIKYLE